MEKGNGQPGISIFEQTRRTLVVAELPGFYEEDLRIDLIDDLLSIFATHGNRVYYRIVKLRRHTEEIIGKVFTGGILEVILGCRLSCSTGRAGLFSARPQNPVRIERNRNGIGTVKRSER